MNNYQPLRLSPTTASFLPYQLDERCHVGNVNLVVVVQVGRRFVGQLAATDDVVCQGRHVGGSQIAVAIHITTWSDLQFVGI